MAGRLVYHTFPEIATPRQPSHRQPSQQQAVFFLDPVQLLQHRLRGDPQEEHRGRGVDAVHREGLITGMAAKMFLIAGPVIVFGTAASVVYGVVLWLLGG